MNINRTTIHKTISKYLQSLDIVIYAYVFGSSVERDNYRDIDVAIHPKENLPMLKIGEIISELEHLVNKKVDLVELNRELLFAKPELVFTIYANGKLLFTKDEELHDEYKSLAYSIYFDTEPHRKMMNEAFQKRIKNNRIGDRNFVSPKKTLRTYE